MDNKTNGEFKIEKNIGLPPSTKGRRWPLHEMEVGDSFLIGPNDAEAQRCRVAARLPNKKFSVRSTPDGYRCWRVE